jgi:large subunit ribosomal protein L24e
MHKKGITEEVAKKRSRKTVKHQRGIVGVGADLQSILAKRNQTEVMRTAARQQAIAKAKEGKKAKEATKVKSKASRPSFLEDVHPSWHRLN